MSDFRFAQAYQQPDKSSAQEGQSLAELALLLPVLLLIMAGVLDLGRALHVYVTVSNATREGARYASLHIEDCPGIRNEIEQEAEGSGVNLSGSNTSVFVEPGCGPDTVAPGQAITVTVTFQFEPITGLILGGQSAPISSSVSMVRY